MSLAIRANLDAFEHEVERQGIAASRDEIARWVHWARAQADTVDPVKHGVFLQRFEGDDSSEE